jgi:hypothetical protein
MAIQPALRNESTAQPRLGVNNKNTANRLTPAGGRERVNIMGEYAKYNGEQIKIGTCENMYYLRYDQRNLVDPIPHSLDPSDESIIGEIRFRFPFPEEDHTEPGAFDDAFKGLGIYGADDLLEGVDHDKEQFVSSRGMNVCLPCPESAEGKAAPYKVHKNGYSGSVRIVQQKRVGAELWTVCECGSCGAKFRLEQESAERLAVAVRAYADREPEASSRATYYHTIADRVLAGYNSAVPA